MNYAEIKSFDDACKALNITPSLPSFEGSPVKHQKALLAHYQLIIIAEAINEGWQPNWADTNEYKYQLWPDIEIDESKASGFGLSLSDYVDWHSATYVGSRLCFKDRHRAKHCFDTFLQLWEDYFLIDK
jgi:hypothetical protein